MPWIKSLHEILNGRGQKIKFAAVRNHESKKKKMNKLRKILSEVSFFLGNPVRRNID